MSSAATSARLSQLPITVEQLGLIDYVAAWDRQRELADQRAEGIGHDTLLLLEHPAVYTAGRRTEPDDRPVDGTPVIDVDRGGKITWHGPGQLVGYPIVKLAEPIDVVRYVRLIEEALITVCSDMGLTCGRIDGRSGVWLPAERTGDQWKPERKVSAIGVRVQRGVALHGFALNCNSVLDGFDNIIPCGIRDAGVTTLSHELGRDVTVDEVIPAVTEAIIAALDGNLPVTVRDIERVTFEKASPTPAFTTVQYS